MLQTVLIIIGFVVFLGIPLMYMLIHLNKVIQKNYIFDVKLFKRKGDILEFSNNYKTHKLPFISLNFNGQKYNFLLDTGADVNVINESAFNVISNGTIQLIPNGLIITAGTDVMSQKANVPFKYINKKFEETFAIMNLDANFNFLHKKHGVLLHGILGSNFFEAHRWSIDFENMVLWTK